MLFCLAVVGYFSYRDTRRIKLHDARNATGHCALCANKLESWRVRELRYRYSKTGPAQVVNICSTCYDRRRKRRWIIWGTVILIILALIILPRVIGVKKSTAVPKQTFSIQLNRSFDQEQSMPYLAKS